MRSEQAAQIAALQSEQAADRQTIRTLQENFATAPTTVTTAQTTATATPLSTVIGTTATDTTSAETAQKKKKPTLPDPPRFEGIRKKFRAWREEMESKLETDGPAIGTDRDQFSYIFARLGDTPQAMASAYYHLHKERGTTAPLAFLDYLSSIYSDPNLAQKALGRLSGMEQGSRESFAAFLPKFEKELADANGAAWSSEIKINYLKRTLNEQMRRELKGQLHMPKEYDRYVCALHDLGANLDEFRAFSHSPAQRHAAQRPAARGHARGSVQSPDASHQQRQDAGDSMDWEPTTVNRAEQRPSNNKDQGLRGKRAKWVQQDELDKRRVEGRCLRCGRSNCRIARCPLLPARPPTVAPAQSARRGRRPFEETAVKRGQPVIEDALVEDSDSDESDGGELKD
jgi:hypothetical protein